VGSGEWVGCAKLCVHACDRLQRERVRVVVVMTNDIDNVALCLVASAWLVLVDAGAQLGQGDMLVYVLVASTIAMAGAAGLL
jgi:hypothetical protein